MRSLLKSPIGRLRLAGIVEGVSFLVLLGIAMPLKYFADTPQAVQVAGWAHGIFFIVFCGALSMARQAAQWSISWSALVLFAALLPFGPFVIDRWLREMDVPCESVDANSKAPG